MKQRAKNSKKFVGFNCKGFRVSQNSKTIEHKNRLSGHKWSENVPINTFSIHGPFTIHSIHSGFRSAIAAMKEIDFIVKFGFHLSENNGC